MRERETYAVVNGTITETIEGARTVDALDLGSLRRADLDAALGRSFSAERYTLWLRSVLFPVINLTHVTVLGSVLMIGGVFVLQGWIGVGQLTV